MSVGLVVKPAMRGFLALSMIDVSLDRIKIFADGASVPSIAFGSPPVGG
jgi:hypothetical protein